MITATRQVSRCEIESAASTDPVYAIHAYRNALAARDRDALRDLLSIEAGTRLLNCGVDAAFWPLFDLWCADQADATTTVTSVAVDHDHAVVCVEGACKKTEGLVRMCWRDGAWRIVAEEHHLPRCPQPAAGAASSAEMSA